MKPEDERDPSEMPLTREGVRKSWRKFSAIWRERRRIAAYGDPREIPALLFQALQCYVTMATIYVLAPLAKEKPAPSDRA